MNVLVVGGAGYIGSHMVRLLDREGHQVVVLDNLSTGFPQAVTAGELVIGEMSDRKLVEQILYDHNIDAVMHFAACALVGESMVDPAKYYQNNIGATIELLEAMRTTNVNKIVFSSTCATYGIPQSIPISELENQSPVNPYGFTKLVIEKALADYSSAYGFGYAALRYFNAAGASPTADIGEFHRPETHLVPIVLQTALGQRDNVTVYGDDWETHDGTCVRDYVHVDDLGRAHLSALERIEPFGGIEVNLGSGRGFSVREVIEACREITGIDIPEISGPRRPGDPPELVADASKAKSVLNWEPTYTDVTSIIETAWHWHRTHPEGYSVEPSHHSETRTT